EPDQLPHRGLSLDVAAALGPNVEPELRSMLERMLELDPDQRASRIQPLLDDYRRARRHKDERASAANAASSRSAGAGKRAARDRQHHHAQGERSEHGTFQGAQWARGAHPRLHRDWFEAREAFQE